MTEITKMRVIVGLARKYAATDPELAVAFQALDDQVAKNVEMRKRMLAAQGVDCVACGYRFMPLHGDYNYCSIGCRFSDD